VIDPSYIELGNVEEGTRFEMINLSAKPDASFDCDRVALPITGEDVASRTAAAYLGADQMAQLNLKPGDYVQIRAVDAAGNASQPAQAQIAASGWGTNWISTGAPTMSRGSVMAMLDGESQRKNVTALESTDTRAPVMLMDRLALAPNSDGSVSLRAALAAEPGARITVQNQSTGSTYSGTVTPGRLLELNIGKVDAGTPLRITPVDSDGVPGATATVVYGPDCKDGKAPNPRGVPPGPLPGVIDA
jgi:hypothetical protein